MASSQPTKIPKPGKKRRQELRDGQPPRNDNERRWIETRPSTQEEKPDSRVIDSPIPARPRSRERRSRSRDRPPHRDSYRPTHHRDRSPSRSRDQRSRDDRSRPGPRDSYRPLSRSRDQGWRYDRYEPRSRYRSRSRSRDRAPRYDQYIPRHSPPLSGQHRASHGSHRPKSPPPVRGLVILPKSSPIIPEGQVAKEKEPVTGPAPGPAPATEPKPAVPQDNEGFQPILGSSSPLSSPPSSPRSGENPQGSEGGQGSSDEDVYGGQFPASGTGLGLSGLAEMNTISITDRIALQLALDQAPSSDLLAGHVKELLQSLEDSAQAASQPLDGFGIKISENEKLYQNDILSLYHLDGYDTAAWLTEPIMYTIMNLEPLPSDDVYIDKDLSPFLNQHFLDQLDEAITAAQDGTPPDMGWPFTDMQPNHRRMVAVINPSENHWMTIQFVAGTDSSPSKLFLYNSGQGSASGINMRTMTESLPKLFYLASLRPNSPLEGFNPYELQVEEVSCAKQANSVDCGPFSLYFLSQALHEQSVDRLLPGTTARRVFGSQLRRACAEVLVNNHNQAASRTSLWEVCQFRSSNLPVNRKRKIGDRSSPMIGNSSSPNPRLKQKPTLPELPHELIDIMEVDDPGDLLELDDKRPRTKYRVVLSESSTAQFSIIIIVRFSTYPKWYTNMPKQKRLRHVIEAIVKGIAQKWLNVLLAALNVDATQMHAILHASLRNATRFIPASIIGHEDDDDDDDNQDEDDDHHNRPPGHEIEPTDDQQKQIEDELIDKVGAKCPFCNYNITTSRMRTDTKKFKSLMYRHLAMHMPKFLKEHPTAINCSYKDCTWKTSIGYGKRSLSIARNTAKQHVGIKHGTNWLETREETIVWTCFCSTGCQQHWDSHNEWSQHVQSLPGWDPMPCPFCSSLLSDSSMLQLHIRHEHWKEQAPGYFRCAAELEAESPVTPWNELSAMVKWRLLRSTDQRCAWGLAMSDACRRPGVDFNSLARLEAHYLAEHEDEAWPFDLRHSMITQCGMVFNSAEELSNHRRHMHGARRTGDNKLSRTYGARKWTKEITADLRQAFNEERPIKPILLSVGIDGFTCNNELLLPWLQQVNISFTLAIVSHRIPLLAPEHWDLVGEDCYIALFDSDILLASLLDRSQAPPAYSELLALWDKKQDNKDGQSELWAPRNERRPAKGMSATDGAAESSGSSSDIDGDFDLEAVIAAAVEEYVIDSWLFES